MKNKTNRFLLVFVLMALSAICFDFPFNSKSVFAYSASITTDNSTVLNVSVNGTGTSIVEKSINVTSDCRNGYNLVVSTTESSDLYLNGNSSGTAAFTAVNGTSTLANSTNKWGYTLTSNPSSSTVFSPLSTTASTLKTPSETASPSSDINDTFPIYYGVKVDDTVSPGSYEMGNNGVIVYYLTMDTTCTQYTVAFNANGGTGSVANQNIQTGESTKLTAADTLTAPTGASYTDANNNTINGQADKLWTFWGWNTAIDGTGDWYKDKEAVEDLANASSTITLYAQWKQATLADLTTGTQVGTEKVIDHNLMQDMSPEACYNSDITTAANAPAATLLDYRGKVTTGDNPESPESYTVSKLADGLCWMTTNLNLGRASGGPNGNGTVALTPDDTDITSNFTLPVSTSTSSTTNTAARIRTTNNSGTNANGVYYSWAAAVASTASINTNPTTTSICPKNWDLPSDTMFTNLKTKAAYSSTNLTTAAPSSFLIDGGFTNGATFYQDTYSHYWTHVSYSATSAQGARVNGTNITTSRTTGTTYGGNKYYMKNIRCVASLGRVTINYDGNGTNEYPVTGTTASQVNAEIVSAKIQANGFTRNGWAFNGWNTAADGSGTSIAADTNISNLDLKPGEVVTLYAQWTPQFTITYVHNCMQWAPNDANCTNNKSISTLEQKINLDANGDGSGTLKNYDAWTNLANWKVAEWTTNANGTGTAYPINSTYAVVDVNLGDSVTLYAHWAPVYSIQYDGNGADNPNGMGTTDQSTGVKSVKQTNVGKGDSVVLLASNFKRTGYGFAGWSTSPTATIGGSDKIYGPMETIDAPAYPTNGTNIITMYAVWVEAEKDGSNNPVYLQDFTISDCNALTKADFNTSTGVITPGSVIALTDKRDDEVYTVAKLADNNCWMVENLRLEHEGTVGNNKNDNSVTNQSLSQGYGGTTGTYGNFVGLADPESANFNSSSTTANTIYKSDGSGDVFNSANGTLEDIGSTNSPAYRFPRYNSNNTQSLVDSITYTQDYTNASSPSDSGTNYRTSSNIYGYGNYYTWAAAMANANYYTGSSTSEVAGTSICPTNWRLPSSNGATKEYGTLSTSYGGTGGNQQDASQSGDIMSNRFRTFPNNFLYSGYFINSSMNYRGVSGYYWSRSASSSYSYNLSLSPRDLYPSNVGTSSSKYYGYSVRCLMDTTYTIQYDGNGADNPNGMGTTDASGNKSVRQAEISEGTQVTLLASNFKRDGYGFAGWSTDPDAWAHFTDNDNTNDPIIYGSMENVVINSSSFSSLHITMYAVWVPAEKDRNNNPVYLQEWDDPADSTDGCAALTKVNFDDTITNEKDKIIVNKNSIIALTDKRDNMVYTIAKLADGNCWMVENMRLDNQYTVGQNQNDPSVTNESLAQGYGGTPGTYGSFVGLADSEPRPFSGSGANSKYYSGTQSGTASMDIGTTNNPGDRMPRYNNDNTSDSVDDISYIQYYINASSPGYTGTNYRADNIYSYGNYYSWAAAIANTSYFLSNSENVGTSICPAGWLLPTSGSSSKNFGMLSQSYGGSGSDQSGVSDAGDIMSNRFRTFPNNFVASGMYYNSYSLTDRGEYGYYVSRSSPLNDTYFLRIGKNYISPSSNNSRSWGRSIRCILGS